MVLIDPDTLHNACMGFLILKMDELQQIAQSINILDEKESLAIEIISIYGKTSTGPSRNKTIKDGSLPSVAEEYHAILDMGEVCEKIKEAEILYKRKPKESIKNQIWINNLRITAKMR